VTEPAFGHDLRRMHLVITRGIQVAAEASDIYAHEGFPDEEMRAGFWLYVAALVALLDAHNAGEDELAWPVLREEMPDAPYADLIAAHETMAQSLDQIREALEAHDMRIFLYLQRLQEQWDEHRSREELAFSEEATADALAPADQARLSRQLAEHWLARAQPPETVVPFVLYNLPPEERLRIMQTVPPAMIQEQIPGEWLAAWAPMRPFLMMQA
jgi:hypothetical protein